VVGFVIDITNFLKLGVKKKKKKKKKGDGIVDLLFFFQVVKLFPFSR
jgi:hypothetical protein